MSTEKVFEANIDVLKDVQSFVMSFLNEHSVGEKEKRQLMIVVEEIFVNIASYAYRKTGEVIVKLEEQKKNIHLTFIDEGVKFNPLENEEPDVSLDANERSIGGLGIFMVKRLVDSIKYNYKDKQNILTIVKSY